MWRYNADIRLEWGSCISVFMERLWLASYSLQDTALSWEVGRWSLWSDRQSCCLFASCAFPAHFYEGTLHRTEVPVIPIHPSTTSAEKSKKIDIAKSSLYSLFGKDMVIKCCGINALERVAKDSLRRELQPHLSSSPSVCGDGMLMDLLPNPQIPKAYYQTSSTFTQGNVTMLQPSWVP